MRMVEDKTCFYIFKNRQSAVMVPKMVLQPDHPKEFQNFIEHKTQKKWHSMAGLLFMKGEDANAFKLPLLQFGAKSQYRD